jgi:hypothetical protein
MEIQFDLSSLDDWRMAGYGGFTLQSGGILETDGGPGLLWYTKQEFGDLELEVDWRIASPTDNSGVFIRMPPLGNGNLAQDWKPAVEQGYEIQIDERGVNPEAETLDDPLHLTGAIYTLAPARLRASLPIGEWNRFEIQAAGTTVSARLNGRPISQYVDDGSRRLSGFIGLQNHHPGSRVQFRNLRLTLP